MPFRKCKVYIALCWKAVLLHQRIQTNDLSSSADFLVGLYTCVAGIVVGKGKMMWERKILRKLPGREEALQEKIFYWYITIRRRLADFSKLLFMCRYSYTVVSCVDALSYFCQRKKWWCKGVTGGVNRRSRQKNDGDDDPDGKAWSLKW